MSDTGEASANESAPQWLYGAQREGLISNRHGFRKKSGQGPP